MHASGSPQCLARQAVIVDGCNTPYHLTVLKRIIKREIIAKSGNVISLGLISARAGSENCPACPDADGCADWCPTG